MEVNGSTQTLHSPRMDLNGDVFQALARAREAQNEQRVGQNQEETPRPVERQTPPLEELQEMVLSPSEVPLEERMQQVISLEDIQRLLLLRAASGTGDSSGLTGNLVDRRA